MKEQREELGKLFVEELKDTFSAEHQITEALPKLIDLASSQQLKTALSNHLEETYNQIERLKEIFSSIGVRPAKKHCEAMEGLLKEGEDSAKKKGPSPMLDALIISACQKVEHYEIAAYGTLRSFAQHLNLQEKILELIEETLKEEKSADKKLTKVAEGSSFDRGINAKAVKNSSSKEYAKAGR